MKFGFKINHTYEGEKEFENYYHQENLQYERDGQSYYIDKKQVFDIINNIAHNYINDYINDYINAYINAYINDYIKLIIGKIDHQNQVDSIMNEFSRYGITGIKKSELSDKDKAK